MLNWTSAAQSRADVSLKVMLRNLREDLERPGAGAGRCFDLGLLPGGKHSAGNVPSLTP